ncbi:MAG: insulinase family protein [FCB group bacterium]|nr:insulinase family protein [FCB group bacterium]
MNKEYLNNKLFFAIIFIFVIFVAVSFGYAKDSTYQLANGMKVILKENHSSPMVASIIFVKSGSKYESRYENGITHFLEHLLFDGTTHLSREQLDNSIGDLGGYINAFTRKDFTAFLVLLPKQYIDYGLTVQADMLFNSTFPENELTKERKVVIEEINRDSDAPSAIAESFFTQKAYANTSYNRPVLGYSTFIENIPRDAIIAYWKKYYTPQNMTVLIIGDFNKENMKNIIDSSLGTIKPKSLTTSNETDSLTEQKIPEKTVIPPVKQGHINGQQIFDTVANVTSTYINFSFAAPQFSDSSYLPFDLLSQYLNTDEISPLLKALKSGDNPLVTEASVSLQTYKEFSRLEISAITSHPENRDKIIATILEQIKATGNLLANNETIEGIKTSVKCQNIYLSEKLHYYAFMIAPMMMTTGWDFVQTYPERLSKITWPECQNAAKKWLSDPQYIATVVTPVGKSQKKPFIPQRLSAAEVKAHFDSVSFKKYDLSQGYDLKFPSTEKVNFEWTDNSVYDREVLPNGLTVIIKSNPDTRVFAMNITGKDRSANEPESKTGITDFVNRCIEKGTYTRNASELSRDLTRIGANITLYDNPWIPYDNFYTTRRFSFMKFETIDEFAYKGFNLFSEMVLFPSFDSAQVEKVRGSMMGILKRNNSSPTEVARNLFYATLFAGNSYANPIMGTPQTISSITVADLKAYHRTFYSPQNMILSIVSPRPIEEIKEWVDNLYGRLKAPQDIKLRTASKPQPIKKIRKAHAELNKKQISIFLGSLLPDANSPDAEAIKVATSILSTHLYLTLREKQGLAYSIGANAILDKNFGWFYTIMGTASKNYQTALDGIKLQIDKLKLDGPTKAEVSKAKNEIWGHLMRAKLSSINQAYYLGMDEYLGRPVKYDKIYLKALSGVTVESVRRAAARYFPGDIYVLATAGKISK